MSCLRAFLVNFNKYFNSVFILKDTPDTNAPKPKQVAPFCGTAATKPSGVEKVNETVNGSSIVTNKPTGLVGTGLTKPVDDTVKAKPNRELLEKLKEEMRKISKIRKTTTQNTVQVSLGSSTDLPVPQHESLLTIAPLLTSNDAEFTLSSYSFLKTVAASSDTKGNAEVENDGKILFSNECAAMFDVVAQRVETVTPKPRFGQPTPPAKRPKLEESDNDGDSQDDDSENGTDDADTEDGELSSDSSDSD